MTPETLAKIVLGCLILTTGVAVLCLLWSAVRWFIPPDKNTSAPNSLRRSLETHSEENRGSSRIERYLSAYVVCLSGLVVAYLTYQIRKRPIRSNDEYPSLLTCVLLFGAIWSLCGLAFVYSKPPKTRWRWALVLVALALIISLVIHLFSRGMLFL
jgi:hypothetical protein